MTLERIRYDIAVKRHLRCCHRRHRCVSRHRRPFPASLLLLRCPSLASFSAVAALCSAQLVLAMLLPLLPSVLLPPLAEGVTLCAAFVWRVASRAAEAQRVQRRAAPPVHRHHPLRPHPPVTTIITTSATAGVASAATSGGLRPRPPPAFEPRRPFPQLPRSPHAPQHPTISPRSARPSRHSPPCAPTRALYTSLACALRTWCGSCLAKAPLV